MRCSRLMIGAALPALLAVSAGAQPTVDRSATAVKSAPQAVTLVAAPVAARGDTLLPVLDDDGEPILETQIATVARPGGPVRRVLYPLLGGLLGMTLMSDAPGMNLDCSIYEPCSDRDRFYKTFALPFGFVAGALLGAALPTGEVTRVEAVRRIRAARREERWRRTP